MNLWIFIIFHSFIAKKYPEPLKAILELMVPVERNLRYPTWKISKDYAVSQITPKTLEIIGCYYAPTSGRWIGIFLLPLRSAGRKAPMLSAPSGGGPPGCFHPFFAVRYLLWHSRISYNIPPVFLLIISAANRRVNSFIIWVVNCY